MSVKKLLGAAMWQGLLLAMLTLLALLAVSSLMLQRGLLPESAAPSMVCVACAAAVFAGSRAVRKGEGGPLPQAAAVAVCLYAALWLIALGGTPQFSIHGPAVTASVFGGALLAGLLGKKRGKRQAGKRRKGEKGWPATGKGRR